MNTSIPGSVAIPHDLLHVSEMERSVRFYEALFGCPPHRRREHLAVFHLDAPPLRLRLLRSGVPPIPSRTYRGLPLPSIDDVALTKVRLMAHGIASFDRPDATCCTARDDILWVRDPDGHGWEVYAETGQHEPLLPPDDSCCTFPDASC